MNRFMPDTWWEALLRPIAMAAPDSHTYVEMMAPDLRFAFAILLALLLLLAYRRSAAGRPVLVLLALVVLAFVPWLASSGNGRYFVAFLLLAGPLCVGLAYALPWSRVARLLLVVGMLTLQTLTVVDTHPWNAWALATWRQAPYFQISLPADVRSRPATFVTITSISYSLVAPQFNPDSRWVNITGMDADPAHSLDTRRAQEVFATAKRLYILVPSVPSEAGPDHMPSSKIRDIMDKQLQVQRLAVDRSKACQFLPSRSAASVVFGDDLSRHKPETLAAMGFWLCPLKYPVAAPAVLRVDTQLDPVFRRIEQSCPTLFPPGSAATSAVDGGAMRNYASADMKLYVLDDGGVYYKYWRALNPVRIGSISEVLGKSFRMDCHDIRGRSGLPWQRDI